MLDRIQVQEHNLYTRVIGGVLEDLSSSHTASPSGS